MAQTDNIDDKTYRNNDKTYRNNDKNNIEIIIKTYRKNHVKKL